MPLGDSMKDMAFVAPPVSVHDEDRHLFTTPLGQHMVSVVPKIRTNRDEERVIHGFIRGDTEIELIFAGRRRLLADPLVARLSRLWAEAKRALPPDAPPQITDIRLPIAVYGAWQSRFTHDEDGWQTKRTQLIVAIWRMRDAQGRQITRGSAPAITPIRRAV